MSNDGENRFTKHDLKPFFDSRMVPVPPEKGLMMPPDRPGHGMAWHGLQTGIVQGFHLSSAIWNSNNWYRRAGEQKLNDDRAEEWQRVVSALDEA